jgi:hypothetical protein
MNATGWRIVHCVARALSLMCASIACFDAKCGTRVGLKPLRETDVYTKWRVPAACAASKNALPWRASVSTACVSARGGTDGGGRGTALAAAAENRDIEDAVQR